MKSTRMDSLFDSLSQRMFGRTWSKCMVEHICLRCGGPAVEFRDENSSDINDVTGYCQKCQDGVEDRPYQVETIFDICPACHEGDMEGGVCTRCGAREIRNSSRRNTN